MLRIKKQVNITVLLIVCVTIGNANATRRRVIDDVFGKVVPMASRSPVTANLWKFPTSQSSQLLDGLVVDHGLFQVWTSTTRRLPTAVTYRLDPRCMVTKRAHKRARRARLKGRGNWKPDPVIGMPFTLAVSDFDGLKELEGDYEIGHSLPYGSFWGHPERRKIDIISAAFPQKKGLNRGAWSSIEREGRQLVFEHRKPVSVAMGPYYDPDESDPEYMVPGCMIPSGYWKIFIQRRKELGYRRTYVTAVLIDQDVSKGPDIGRYYTSIDELRKLTGLPFFPDKNFEFEEIIQRGD